MQLRNMIRIGFDAKRAFHNFTGLGNYSRSLLLSLARYYPENEYWLYTPKARETARTRDLFAEKSFRILSPKLPFTGSVWRTYGIAKRLVPDGIQLYHGLSHELPYGIHKLASIKKIVTVHDLISFRYPDYYKKIDRDIYTAKYKYACQTADKIVAISEQTKRDLIGFLRVPEEKISVIYQACDPSFRLAHNDAALREAVSKKYGLPSEYLLNVGTIEERKNLLLLARAYKNTPEAPPVVVVGKPTPYLAKVKSYLEENDLSHRFIFLHQVAFPDLPYLYKGAQIFLYLSRFEGFGIPIIEALCSGTPVIAAKGSCLEEAGGPGSFYVGPDDPEALTEAIRALSGDPSLRRSMTADGLLHASRFTEEEHARQNMSLYRSLL